MEDIYFNPFDLKIDDTFDDASKIMTETFDPEPETETNPAIENKRTDELV